MAKSNFNNIFLFGLAAGAAFYLAKPKSRTITISLKTVPSNPPAQLPPPPKQDNSKQEISEEIKQAEVNKLFGNQQVKRLLSNVMDNNTEAPLILIIPPRGIKSTSEYVYYTENKEILDLIPTNLNARVFLFLTDDNYYDLTSSAKIGKILISGLKKLQETYPTNKVLVLGFGYGIGIALYLAGSNAIDATFVRGYYGIYNYGIKFPGSTQLYGWIPNNAVGDKWWEVSQEIFTLYKGFDVFAKAKYPTPEFLKGVSEQQINSGEIYNATNKMINLKPYIPNIDNPGFEIEYDGNLDQCAIILKSENIEQAVWALTSTAITTARSMNGLVSTEDFWNIVNGFFGQINSKCLVIDRYWDDAPDAMFGYWAIRSAIRALMNRGLMSPENAATALNQAKVEAIKNGVTNLPEYFPSLKNDFE